jgi:hypothetical protein
LHFSELSVSELSVSELPISELHLSELYGHLFLYVMLSALLAATGFRRMRSGEDDVPIPAAASKSAALYAYHNRTSTNPSIVFG